MQQNFEEFLTLWNTEQGFQTPYIHTKIANWLQNCYESGDKQLLLMAFRACGKSTLIGLFCSWILLQRPDFRILVLAAESNLATKMVRNIRKIIERHPSTKSLIPDKREQWASDRFTINRDIELRDPSVLAAGVTGNITGSRADIIIYDDVEVPNTSNTMRKRENLREILQESNFILSPGGIQLYVGTPHTYFSIYADTPRHEIGEKEIFLEGFKRYVQPVLNRKKKSVWPTQFSLEIINKILRQSGPNKFAAQMMLQPINIINGRLNVDLLHYYEHNLKYTESQRRIYLSLNDKKLISCSTWWDPAFGNIVNGDSSVVAIIFTDEDGHNYLHHISYITICPDINKNEDEATLQCKHVVNLAKKFSLPSITIETNGIGQFLPAILKREMADQNIPCSVISKVSTKNKSERILEAFDVVLAAQALSVHDSVKDTPFIMEMTEWQPKKKNMNDDGLDAVAGALSLEPIRIQRSVITAKRKFFHSTGSFTANTDFKI